MDDTPLYRLAKQRIVRTALSMDDNQLRQICPSCPRWTNQDVIAHHVHFLGALIDDAVPDEVFGAITDIDAETRSTAGRTRDQWTQAGVQTRRNRNIHELLAEWDVHVERMPPKIGPTVDAVVHLGDIWEALGERRGPDTTLVVHTLARYYDGTFADRVAALGASVILRCTDTGDIIGGGVEASEIRGTAYELLRAIAGRRTRTEANAALDWSATSAAAQDVFPAYGWPDH